MHQKFVNSRCGRQWAAAIGFALTSFSVTATVFAKAPITPHFHSAIRHLRGTIYSVSGRTKSAARRMGAAAQSMQYNRVGTAQQAALLTRDAAALSALARQPTGQTMPAVRTGLGQALYGKSRGPQIVAARANQRAVLAQLDKIISQLHTLTPAALAESISAVIHQQTRVQVRTAALFTATLGESRSQLSRRQRARLKRNAQQQRALSAKVRQVTEALQQAADKAQKKSQLSKASAYNKAIAVLGQANVSHLAARSASNIRRNHLGNAQTQQTKVIAALKHARRLLQARGEFSESNLYHRLRQIQSLAAKEKGLLGQTQTLPTSADLARFHRLEMGQAQVAAAVARLGIHAAVAPAQGARRALGKRQQTKAAGGMKKTLAALHGAARALLASMGPSHIPGKKGHHSAINPHAIQTASKSHRGQYSAVVNGQGQGRRSGVWRLALTPAQKAALDTSAAQRFPARYRAALEAYYKNLAASRAGGAQ